MERYVERIEQDLSVIRKLAAQWEAIIPESVDSIYLGGGTPSLLPPQLLNRLFTVLRREFAVLPTAEITVECAPGQLGEAELEAMAGSGVNRISFGVQSFIDAEAKHAGRLHTREIALRDVERVRQAGIRHINLDLIAGLAGQTATSWRESLDVLASAATGHASIYMLEVDDDSRLGREVGSGGLRYYAPQVPSDDFIAEMYIEAAEFLAARGLPQYEISNFAHPEAESLHNLKYWLRKPYLGFGLDAHSMLRSQAGAAVRFATTDELEPFLKTAGWDDANTLSPEEELEEAWFLGLRLHRGVDLAVLKTEFGEQAVSSFDPVLHDLEKDGFIEQTAGAIKLTERGRLLSNNVFEQFLHEPALT